MGSGIGIAPSVMINRIVHERGAPPGGQLLEVARVQARLEQARVTETLTEPQPDKAVTDPANGAEVDRLV